MKANNHLARSRREFVKGALAAAAGASLLAPRASAAPSSAPSSTSTQETDRFDLEPAQQFDLPHRAGLAIHCLTGLLDERQDYLPYFNVHYSADPPVATHNRWDYGDCVGRYVEALKLARIMSGNTQAQQADAAFERWLERLLGEHGLSWWPDPPYDPILPSTQARHVADLAWSQRSTLAGLTTQYEVTGEQHFADLAKRLVDGLHKLALWDDGMAYFPLEATRIHPLSARRMVWQAHADGRLVRRLLRIAHLAAGTLSGRYRVRACHTHGSRRGRILPARGEVLPIGRPLL